MHRRKPHHQPAAPFRRPVLQRLNPVARNQLVTENIVRLAPLNRLVPVHLIGLHRAPRQVRQHEPRLRKPNLRLVTHVGRPGPEVFPLQLLRHPIPHQRMVIRHALFNRAVEQPRDSLFRRPQHLHGQPRPQRRLAPAVPAKNQQTRHRPFKPVRLAHPFRQRPQPRFISRQPGARQRPLRVPGRPQWQPQQRPRQVPHRRLPAVLKRIPLLICNRLFPQHNQLRPGIQHQRARPRRIPLRILPPHHRQHRMRRLLPLLLSHYRHSASRVINLPFSRNSPYAFPQSDSMLPPSLHAVRLPGSAVPLS